MLNIVTWRTSNIYAQNHIVADGYWHAFCGQSMPVAIREVWYDPRNPYRNKGNATCPDCVEEWKNGRKEGYRNEQDVSDVSTPVAPESHSPGADTARDHPQ